MIFDIESHILDITTCDFIIRYCLAQILACLLLARRKLWTNLGACMRICFFISILIESKTESVRK